MSEKQVEATDGLNEQQREAVTLGRESSLVLAGAGSGKTKVLTSRIAWLIKNGHASEDSILAVTFTNKSAREMRKRIEAILGHNPKKLWIGTFHGLCYRMLRDHREALGLPEVLQIMDVQDQKAQVRRIMEKFGMSKDEIKSSLDDNIDFINMNKEVGTRAKNAEALEQSMLDIYAEYEAVCQREGMFDFAELMMRVNEYLANDKGGMRTFFNNKFSDILVDEFQDTNDMQYKWLNYLHGGKAVVMAVGDDDQSIYAFRGANPSGMQDFMNTVAGGKIIRLEQNYRSSSTILNVANAIIKNNPNRLGKNLRTDSPAGAKISVHHFDFDMPGKHPGFNKTAKTEVESIAKGVKAMLSYGTPPSEIAILYRSNSQAFGVERYLTRAGIPYVIHGGTKYFERAEVKNAMAYLRLAVNQNDDLAFLRVVNFPPRGMGDKAVEKLVEIARSNQISLTEACLREADAGNEKAGAFADIIMRTSSAADMLDLDDAIDFILDNSGIIKYYENEASKKASKQEKEEELERGDRVREMINIASSFISDPLNVEGKTSIDIVNDFLVGAALESDQEKGKKLTGDTVTLMTVHSSKGLEFDNIIVTGLNEGLFPHARSQSPDEIEEERRLMYVAVTRARKTVTLTASSNRLLFGKSTEYGTSRFMEEIPPEFASVHDHREKVKVEKMIDLNEPFDDHNQDTQPAPAEAPKPKRRFF